MKEGRGGFLKGDRCRGAIATNMAISKSIAPESDQDRTPRSLTQPKRVVAVQPLSDRLVRLTLT